MEKLFKGVCAVAVTPFKKDGSFDYEAAKKNLDYLIDSGVHGVCILGATGEYMSISLEEHKEYVKEIVPYIKKRVKVMVGATREMPDDVIDLILNAKKYGADAAMVLPSPYCHPAQNEVLEHYRYIAEETDFPIMVYNNPHSAGISIDDDTLSELFEIENVALVKESSGQIQNVTRLLMSASKNISVLCGADNLAYESFSAGADGWVSMLANVAPKDCVELYENICEKGDLSKAFEIYKKILPALDFLESFPKPVQTLKYMLNIKGLNGGFVRRPRLELTDEEKAYIEAKIDIDSLN